MLLNDELQAITSETRTVQFVAVIFLFIHAISWPCFGSNLFVSSFSFWRFFVYLVFTSYDFYGEHGPENL